MKLEFGDVSLDVQSFGAMITGGRFRLPGGSAVEPFFRNPWRDDDTAEMEPFLRNLGAEWPCVPFGTPGMPAGLPDDWRVAASPDWNEAIHGFGSHREWEIEPNGPGGLVATIAYPDHTPVRSLTRTIDIGPDTLAVRIGLRIEARQATRLAIGMHPVFNLVGCSAGSCEIRQSGNDTAWSFPVDVEPGHARFRPDQRGFSLRRATAPDGRIFDGTRVPFAELTEDLLLLTEPGDSVGLVAPELGYRVDVGWNAQHFPGCSLWYSNGGRRFPPWNGRVRAIGIEPTSAAFNLGQIHSLSDQTPLARQNIRTFVAVEADTPWETAYTISVSEL